MSEAIWTGIHPWCITGDGVTSPFGVVSPDASGALVGFYPFGFALPGMLRRQAQALCDLLNERQRSNPLPWESQPS